MEISLIQCSASLTSKFSGVLSIIVLLLISQYINEKASLIVNSLLFSFVSPTLFFFSFLFFFFLCGMVFSDALVEHFTQVRYRFVWNLLVLIFQMMTTRRKVSPLSIQGDTSMHSAWSFHRRECNPAALKMNKFVCL